MKKLLFQLAKKYLLPIVIAHVAQKLRTKTQSSQKTYSRSGNNTRNKRYYR
ncbi:hypothetical protein [Simonsiella muelleri]|uniref:hypothetical protein n=1 Tax=Simonsiella muelleri TaxID=72 RepID=UPI0023F54B4E|nr:hypothetical protein [Simonsiella muelleri]